MARGLGISQGAVHGVEVQAAERDQRKRRVREQPARVCISRSFVREAPPGYPKFVPLGYIEAG